MKNAGLQVMVASLCFALVAWAAEPVVCAVTTSTSTASSTILSSDGGTCVWAAGTNVLMQCTTDVYVNSTAHMPVGNIQSDGGWYYDGGITGTAASALDQRVDFTSNSDPYPIYLDQGDRHVSLLAVSSAGSCKFMTTKRPKPGQAK